MGGEGRFFYSHLLRRGILKPSSAPLGVIQDTCLNDSHKGREVFFELRPNGVLRSS
jgi:hypothetical protein